MADSSRPGGMCKLPSAPDCYGRSPILEIGYNSGQNTILFRTDEEPIWRPEMVYKPRPVSAESQDHLNDDSVLMPSSKHCKIVIHKSNGEQRKVEKWSVISDSLGDELFDFEHLKNAILSYNPTQKQSWNFDSLKSFLEQNPELATRFFQHSLPHMQQLALKLPVLILQPIPFLKKNTNCQLTMSQEQAACLLANAFFCTFPKRSNDTETLPSFNFNGLFNGQYTAQKREKLKCIAHYFDRIRQIMPNGAITFTRQLLSDRVDISDFENRYFTKMDASPVGKIEDVGTGMLQVVFAHNFVGGLIFKDTCAQESIRFSICPEMIVSRLVTPVLTDLEVLNMTGCERFSNYRGYNTSFRWEADHQDMIERDPWGRKYTEVVAMDALRNDIFKDQFKVEKVTREFNKAVCAFKCLPEWSLATVLPAVCTGNWGCGINNGDTELKALIQMMAASYAKRDICYLTYDDHELTTQMKKIHDHLFDEEVPLKIVWNEIQTYWPRGDRPNESLFGHLAKKFGLTLK